MKNNNYILNSKRDNKTTELIYEEFLDSLLKSDLNKALLLSNDFIKEDHHISLFWEEVILPCLYEIGYKWEKSIITVGEEHTATSICQRVMSEHYSKIITHINKIEKIIVATAPFELHEIGARIISDLLELRSYNVEYLGSKFTLEDILNIFENNSVSHLIFSQTIDSNTKELKELISSIKEKLKDKTPTIIVGGQAFRNNNKAAETLGVDYCILSFTELINFLEGNKVA